MNKIYKYKPGDKVILLKGVCGYKANDISKIIGYNNSGYIINVPNRISTSPDYKPNVWINNNDIKYYYEKPLQDLFNRINIAYHPPNSKPDYDIIRSFIDSNETLTDKELLICQKLWEKYNKISYE